MKKSVFVAAVAAATLVAGAVQNVQAQGVAIIDVGYIFKEYRGFQNMKEDLKRLVDAAEEEFNARGEGIRKQDQQLLQLKTGTPDYKQLEQAIANSKAKLQADVQLKKKEFLEREARIYYTVYQAVKDEVAHIAKGRYNLVLRFNGEPIDPSQPPNVLKELNRAVIHYDPAIDITPYVLKALNDRLGPSTTGQNSNPAAASRPNFGVPRQGFQN